MVRAYFAPPAGWWHNNTGTDAGGVISAKIDTGCAPAGRALVPVLPVLTGRPVSGVRRSSTPAFSTPQGKGQGLSATGGRQIVCMGNTGMVCYGQPHVGVRLLTSKFWGAPAFPVCSGN